jgi:hypothetical protein
MFFSVLPSKRKYLVLSFNAKRVSFKTSFFYFWNVKKCQKVNSAWTNLICFDNQAEFTASKQQQHCSRKKDIQIFLFRSYLVFTAFFVCVLLKKPPFYFFILNLTRWNIFIANLRSCLFEIWLRVGKCAIASQIWDLIKVCYSDEKLATLEYQIIW